ncbi:gastric triacylglycerol lipase-like isoform X2 [Prorops nasuta]|uniref:gastric triacylglycerol lipase-like isoform X2 n=1 Tax=Prorops nasuta TaxID=863751 RepID=UPI0034CE498B
MFSPCFYSTLNSISCCLRMDWMRKIRVSLLQFIQDLRLCYNFFKNNILPSSTIDNYSRFVKAPDVYLNTAQMLTKYGYVTSSHVVETDDGYLLTIFRVIGSKKSPAKYGKPVVMLQHGLLMSSDDWVVPGHHRKLAYELVDEGYEVWLSNSRGNTYGRTNKYIPPDNKHFWDFTFHEMGFYDLPAVIDHILLVTGKDKLYYIGHSQGANIFFTMMSEKPQYNEKIQVMFAYAPTINNYDLKSPLIRVVAYFTNFIYKCCQCFRINEILGANQSMTKFLKSISLARTPIQILSRNILFLIFGYSGTYIDQTIIPVIVNHTPAGCSIKQLAHYGQLVQCRKFQMFDYKEKNVNYYGQLSPPEYNITKTSVPIVIFYSSNDSLTADFTGLLMFLKQIPNLIGFYNIPDQLFNHVDFLYASHAYELIYKSTIEIMNNLNREIFINDMVESQD